MTKAEPVQPKIGDAVRVSLPEGDMFIAIVTTVVGDNVWYTPVNPSYHPHPTPVCFRNGKNIYHAKSSQVDAM